jgi:hypothetical protein
LLSIYIEYIYVVQVRTYLGVCLTKLAITCTNKIKGTVSPV